MFPDFGSVSQILKKAPQNEEASGTMDCVEFVIIRDFVTPRFFSIHFHVTLAGLKNIAGYKWDFFIRGLLLSGIHCND